MAKPKKPKIAGVDRSFKPHLYEDQNPHPWRFDSGDLVSTDFSGKFIYLVLSRWYFSPTQEWGYKVYYLPGKMVSFLPEGPYKQLTRINPQ